MDERDAAAVDWLLAAPEPAVRELTRHTLLDVSGPPDDEGVMSGPWVSALLADQQPDGGFGGDPYRKWTGAHWRLVALAGLGAPGDDQRIAAAAEHVLAWISNDLKYPPRVVAGLPRAHASIHGNALGACTRLGLAGDERMASLAHAIISWQWPDGGWNCDNRANGRRSSFHESGCTAWGLHEFALATGDPDARAAADRAVELFLEHRLFRRGGSGRPINGRWLSLSYPSYWHYDLLSALVLVTRVGKASDTRIGDALDVLESKRRADGRWDAGPQWWRGKDSRVTPSVVDWGRAGEPNLMVTLCALEALQSAGRVDLSS